MLWWGEREILYSRHKLSGSVDFFLTRCGLVNGDARDNYWSKAPISSKLVVVQMGGFGRVKVDNG